MIIKNGEGADIKVGNALLSQNIAVGTMVHCIELKPEKGAELCSVAWTSVQILGCDGKYAISHLQSDETRKI